VKDPELPLVIPCFATSACNGDVGHCFAVKRFAAAVLLGLRGHGYASLWMWQSILTHVHGIRHSDAYCWHGLCSLRKDEDDGEALVAMEQSLQDRQHHVHDVLDEIAMLVVEMFDDLFTVNIIMGVTTMETLTVTSFAGEEQD